jgi:hypothetical protein
MSMSGTMPHRRCTSALILRRLRGSGWASAGVSRIAPDFRSAMSSHPILGSPSFSSVSSATICSRSSSTNICGSNGLRSSR